MGGGAGISEESVDPATEFIFLTGFAEDVRRVVYNVAGQTC